MRLKIMNSLVVRSENNNLGQPYLIATAWLAGLGSLGFGCKRVLAA
jgi:hypothetical protein